MAGGLALPANHASTEFELKRLPCSLRVIRRYVANITR
jgi:hypothetical protein